jgi:GNAT superfamily N-acetyltransferase
VRRRGQKFIAVTCHDDVIEWLDPDWIYYPATASFDWRLVRRRPQIELQICRVNSSAWRYFANHHYLTHKIHPGAVCFVAFWRGQPVAFDSWLPFFGKCRTGKGKRGHRTVCLPDFQGVGIGNALLNHLCSMWAGLGYQVMDTSGHPALNAARARSPLWKLKRAPSLAKSDGNKNKKAGVLGTAINRMGATRSLNRLTASFEYVGPRMPREQAEQQLNSWAE